MGIRVDNEREKGESVGAMNNNNCTLRPAGCDEEYTVARTFLAKVIRYVRNEGPKGRNHVIPRHGGDTIEIIGSRKYGHGYYTV